MQGAPRAPFGQPGFGQPMSTGAPAGMAQPGGQYAQARPGFPGQQPGVQQYQTGSFPGGQQQVSQYQQPRSGMNMMQASQPQAPTQNVAASGAYGVGGPRPMQGGAQGMGQTAPSFPAQASMPHQQAGAQHGSYSGMPAAAPVSSGAGPRPGMGSGMQGMVAMAGGAAIQPQGQGMQQMQQGMPMGGVPGSQAFGPRGGTVGGMSLPSSMGAMGATHAHSQQGQQGIQQGMQGMGGQGAQGPRPGMPGMVQQQQQQPMPLSSGGPRPGVFGGAPPSMAGMPAMGGTQQAQQAPLSAGQQAGPRPAMGGVPSLQAAGQSRPLQGAPLSGPGSMQGPGQPAFGQGQLQQQPQQGTAPFGAPRPFGGAPQQQQPQAAPPTGMPGPGGQPNPFMSGGAGQAQGQGVQVGAQAQSHAQGQNMQQKGAPGSVTAPFGSQQQAMQPQQHQQFSDPSGMPQMQMQSGGQGRAGGMGGMGMGMGGPLPAAMVGGPTAPPMMANSMGAGAPGQMVAMANVNDAACCAPAYMSMTVNAIPSDSAVLAKTALPFGLCIHPISEGEGTLRGRIPVVDFGPAGVIRCKKCRAYVNPFVSFLDGGRRWKCNFCHFVNDVPAQYFAPCDDSGRRVDAHQRPELSTGSVEFIAPVEYMVRPPQPPVYMFVLDVSFSSVSTGVLAHACSTIRACLDRLPGGDRAQVGFVTFDTSVHFYRLSTGSSSASTAPSGSEAGAQQPARNSGKPQQLVISDIDDLFLPVPTDLVVNLSENREAVENLLASLPTTFAQTRVMDSALGAALDGGFQVMRHIGGKMVVVQACLPSVGPGKLKPREGPRMLGGEQEHTLLGPAPSDDGALYKNKAVDFSKDQISVDMFLFNHAYADVASVGALARYTAGQVYFYPSFHPAVDGSRFSADLSRDLTRNTGFEAVMRIRASKGVNISNFYGNFFIRGQDLLALPNVTPETAFNVELAHEEPLQPGTVVAVQAALLYTTSTGERRICVHTLAKPVTQNPLDLFARADVDSIANALAKVALDHELRLGVAAARRYLHKALLDMCRAYRAATTTPYGIAGMGHAPGGMGGMGGAAGPAGMASRMPMPMPGQPQPGGPGAAGQGGAADMTALLPESLQMLPLYVMGLQKSSMFRGGEQVRSDERALLVYRCLSMPVVHSKVYVYPRMYSLHDLDPSAGRPDPAFESDPATQGQGRVTLPPVQTLSGSILHPGGCYILDNGVEQYLWLGREVPGGLLNALFGVDSLASVDSSQLSLVDQGNDYSTRVCGIARTLALEAYSAPKLRIVRENAAAAPGGGGAEGLAEARFHWHMVEDRQAFPGGSLTYKEYVNIVTKEAGMVSMGGAPGSTSTAAGGLLGCCIFRVVPRQ